MTILIKQLVVRAVVDAPKPEAGRASVTWPAPAAPRAEPESSASWQGEERRRLIAECVRGVMRELERARRR